MQANTPFKISLEKQANTPFKISPKKQANTPFKILILLVTNFP